MASPSGCSGTLANGATVDTSTAALGPHPFSVTATDKLGNSGSSSLTYYVQYSLTCGRKVLQPLEQVDNTQPSPWNQLTRRYKLGSTLPVKFQLCDHNGEFVGTAIAYVAISKVNNAVDVNDPYVSLDSGQSSDNAAIFRYDPVAKQYIYNLSTKSPGVPWSTGTWKIAIRLNNGTTIVTYFELSK